VKTNTIRPYDDFKNIRRSHILRAIAEIDKKGIKVDEFISSDSFKNVL